MNFDLSKEIIKAISLIPGIYGFASMDFSQSSRKLSENNYLKALVCEESAKGTLVKVAIIVSLKINSKIICKEIISSVNNIFKQNKLKLNEVLIYIRGVN